MARQQGQKRRVLLLYPEFPPTYWGLQFSLPVIGRKSFMPPLGLLTVAALCPEDSYEFRLVDLNCGPLTKADLEWSEVVLISAMLAQKFSVVPAAARCREAGKIVILGGPYPTSTPEECLDYADVIVAGEAEITWPQLLADLERGTLQRRYAAGEDKPDLTQTPVPRFDLVRTSDYFTIPIQFSRGCPFQCEFCDIIVMFGRKPRTKTPEQIQRELSAIHATGYRGDVFFVDDNFIGNKKKVMEVLAGVQEWNQLHGQPYEYTTEASVDLAEKPDLLAAMVKARFRRAFLGIESPSAASLQETKKFQNLRSSIEDSVNTIAAAGINVMAGFIVGFDSDPQEIYDLQIEMISRLPIPLAMVARLQAAPGTPLWTRMERDGRLTHERQETHVPGRVGESNIIPLGPPEELLRGYQRVLESIYTPQAYFGRVWRANRTAPRPGGFWAGVQAVRAQLSISREYGTSFGRVLSFFGKLRPAFRREALRLLLRLIWRRPDRLGLYLGYVILGHHMYTFTHRVVLPHITEQLSEIEAGLIREPAPQPTRPRRLVLASASEG